MMIIAIKTSDVTTETDDDKERDTAVSDASYLVSAAVPLLL